MRDYCYEIMINYNKNKGGLDYISDFIGNMVTFGNSKDKMDFEIRYESPKFKDEREYINEVMEVLYGSFLYWKVNYNDSAYSDHLIIEKMIFALWKYSRDAYNDFRSALHTVFGALDVEYCVQLAFEQFVKKDLSPRKKVLCRDIKVEWIDDFPDDIGYICKQFEAGSIGYSLAKRNPF